MITTSHHNLLLVGSSPATDAMLHALEPHLRQPLLKCEPKTGVVLPQPDQGTLILSELAWLDSTQQAHMVRWLNQVYARVQVICTSSQPIFSLVQAGAFLDELYYRLNVVRLDLTPSRDCLL